MTALKFPRYTPRHGGDWIIDPAFLQRVSHSIDPDHPHEFTPTLEQMEVTLLALEVIPSALFTKPEKQQALDAMADNARELGLTYEQPAPAQPMTQDMVESCPYYAETLRGAYFDGWLKAEAAHGITKGNT